MAIDVKIVCVQPVIEYDILTTECHVRLYPMLGRAFAAGYLPTIFIEETLMKMQLGSMMRIFLTLRIYK